MKSRFSNFHYLFSLGVLVLLSNLSVAQDYHFSQYNQNHSLINPGLIGALGNARANLVYRNQWRSISNPFTTYGGSAESRLSRSSVEPKSEPETEKVVSNRFEPVKNSSLGLGVYSFAGGVSGYKTFQANLSFASRYYLTPKSFLSFGIQGAFNQRSVDLDDLLFPSQFNGINYDPSLSNNETTAPINSIYGEFSGGVVWHTSSKATSVAANDHFEALVGLSLFNMNRAYQSDRSLSERSFIQGTFHGEVSFGLRRTTYTISPMWFVQWAGPASEINFGAMIRHAYKEGAIYTDLVQRSTIGFGLHHRWRDAIIVNVLYDQGNYAIGLSYDFNVSPLRTVSNYRGGVELTLVVKRL